MEKSGREGRKDPKKEKWREGGRKGEREERKWSLPIEVKEPLVCFNKVTFQLSLVRSSLSLIPDSQTFHIFKAFSESSPLYA